MKVRPLRAEDWPQLRPMLLDMGCVDEGEMLEARFRALCSSPDWTLLGAERDGVLLGYAALQDYGPHLRSGDRHRTAKLHDLYTLPGWRRQGVARALMDEVRSWAVQRPLRYVFWYASQREASAAYQRLGFIPEGSGQEGYDFFELDLGNPLERLPHPERGS